MLLIDFDNAKLPVEETCADDAKYIGSQLWEQALVSNISGSTVFQMMGSPGTVERYSLQAATRSAHEVGG